MVFLRLFADVRLLSIVDEIVDILVDCGAVPVLTKVLQTAGTVTGDSDCDAFTYQYDVEKESAFVLGLLSVKVITY